MRQKKQNTWHLFLDKQVSKANNLNVDYSEAALNLILFSEHTNPTQLPQAVQQIGANTNVNTVSIRNWGTVEVNDDKPDTILLIKKKSLKTLKSEKWGSYDYLFMSGKDVESLFQSLLELPNLSKLEFVNVFFESPTKAWFKLLKQLGERCGAGLSFKNCSLDRKVLKYLSDNYGSQHTDSKSDYCTIDMTV